MENMTEMTKNMHRQAMGLETVAQAAELLARSGQFRTLGDILCAAAGDREPRGLLVEGLCAAQPGASRDSMDRKVRNWLSGRTQTVSKEDAWGLAAILGLDLEQTDLFLKQVTGEGIHWRSPAEIVRAYGIFRELPPAELKVLLERVNVGGKKRGSGEQTAAYTAQVEQKARPMLHRTPEELMAFLEENRESLGVFHNTAHRLFLQYLEVLEEARADDGMDDEPRVTTRYILEHYLHRSLVPVAKREDAGARAAFSAIQRSIRANWPDEQTLSKMKNREMDVSRKVLIMLFLATDGGEAQEPSDEDWPDWDDYDDYDDWDEEPLTRDERFQAVTSRLDTMLRSCGFQSLDPRSPFDWMVLFSLCAEDLWDVDHRLRQTLAAIFPDGNG